ncbi:cytochrome C oxidase subunit IV family protein [Nocardia sp. alder85J]|uniref:cytochrome C oxidase subunit IV family protein n=1 Tax=Nocardia sp. alder85J TaxID=2862949 RepID=UPI001CD1C474|nr:cytochrome C oxidase subunit IV family protein [Nocardia sp. alder85J]MCX4098090.1 cytochrome C oxidase subunit IV family protein [Nocardia sp. alder85J]
MTAPSPARLDPATRTIVLVWAALTAITVVAWRLAPGHSDTAALSKGLVVAIVVLAMIKCRLVIRYFMEVRHAPRWLRLATDTWLIVLWATLLGIYLY